MGDSTALYIMTAAIYPDAAGEADETEKNQKHEEDVRSVGGISLYH